MSGKLSTIARGALTLAIAQLFVGSVMAEQLPYEHLIPGRGLFAHGENNSLLDVSHTGYLAAIYFHVDIAPPWAFVIREDDKDRTFLERREVSGGDLLFGGTIKTVSKEIPRDLATAIASAIGRMVGEAQQPEKIPVPKREGTTVEFLSFGMDNTGQSAWTRSPIPTTQPGKLVELSATLWSMSEATGDEFTNLQEKAADIARELTCP